MKATSRETTRGPGSTARSTTLEPHLTPLLIKAKAAAALLDLSERTLWTYAKSVAIPSYRVGARMRRFNPYELKQWVANGCNTTPGSGAAIQALGASGEGDQA